LPWRGEKRALGAEGRPVTRRSRRRSNVQRWFPTAAFGALVGGMIFLFAALRLASQPAEPARSAPAETVEIVEAVTEPQVAAAVAEPPAAQSAPAPGEIVTRQNGVTFSMRQVEPTYTVTPGDSLSSIAQRYGTTAEAIQSINNLSDTFLRVNQRLILP